MLKIGGSPLGIMEQRIMKEWLHLVLNIHDQTLFILVLIHKQRASTTQGKQNLNRFS